MNCRFTIKKEKIFFQYIILKSVGLLALTIQSQSLLFFPRLFASHFFFFCIENVWDQWGIYDCRGFNQKLDFVNFSIGPTFEHKLLTKIITIDVYYQTSKFFYSGLSKQAKILVIFDSLCWNNCPFPKKNWTWHFQVITSSVLFKSYIFLMETYNKKIIFWLFMMNGRALKNQ